MIEPEFASVLKASAARSRRCRRRCAPRWDGRPLAILTRTAPARATTAHIALIGHITQHELRRHTTNVELANGYINRLLLIACRRQRLLPEGGDPDPLARHRPRPPARRHPQARPDRRTDPPRPRRPRALASTPTASSPEPQPGDRSAQITARAEAHTIRLALLYALADGQRQIGPRTSTPRSRSRTTPPAPPPGR